MKSSLIDAGPITALFDKDDRHHQRMLDFLQDYEGRLTTTWPVLAEVSYMLDFNKQVQLDFLGWISEGGVELFNLDQWQLKRVREITDKYFDLPADFADATLITVAESAGINSVISIDRDFHIYRFGKGQSLKNMLE